MCVIFYMQGLFILVFYVLKNEKVSYSKTSHQVCVVFAIIIVSKNDQRLRK